MLSFFVLFKFFCIVSYNNNKRIPILCMCSGETYEYAITFHRSEGKKKSDKYDIPWDLEYGATNNCNNPHMSLPHQSVPLELK